MWDLEPDRLGGSVIVTPDTDNGSLPLKGAIPVVFLAGGITGCPDWQSDLIPEIECDDAPFILANPRRAHWDMSIDSRDQITWEHAWLERADIVSFWFPQETPCPITLYGLADVTRRVMADGDNLDMVVGAHPEYQRLFDIEFQTQLRLGPNFHVAKSLDVLAGRINRRLNIWWEDATYNPKCSNCSHRAASHATEPTEGTQCQKCWDCPGFES